MLKILNFHKAFLSAALCVGACLLAGCLPDGKEPGATSDAGKLSGAFYAAGLGNLAIQIQNKVVTDPRWFSTEGVTMELPLRDMSLSMANLGAPIRSFICPTGVDTQVMQLTWLDGRGKNDKFELQGVGKDSGKIITILRERAGAENVGTYTGSSSLPTVDGKTITIPASCGRLPIPVGAPVVAFTIARPARPLQELSRVEYRTVPCEEGQTGTRMQHRTVTYKTTGEITPTDPNAGWSSPDGVGSCIQDVDVALKDRTVDQTAGSVNLNSFANVDLRKTLKEQLEMGCTTVTVTSSVRNDKKISSCTTLEVEGKTAIASQAGVDQSDRRTLSCANSSSAPLTGITNVGNGLTTNYTWQSGHAVIVRKVNANNVNDGTASNDINQWEGSTAAGDLNCVGYEEVEIPCSAITEGRAAYTPQQDGTMWHSFNSNPWNHWNVNVVALSRNYFTGTFQHKNGSVKLRRPISATTWANNQTFTPRIDGQTWTITQNECVVARRALYPENGCAPTFVENDLGNPVGNWYPSHGAGYRPRTIIDEPIQFTGDANTLPSRFQELRNMGYLPQRGTDLLIKPSYLYSYPFGGYAVDMKQWVGNGYHDTLLGLNGILYGQVVRLVNNNKLVYTPMDKNRFAEPYTCGRDSTERVLADARVLSGTMSNYTTTATKVWTTVNTYREWRGYAYDSGSWSQPSVAYTPDQGYWSGGVVTIDQRTADIPEWSMDNCQRQQEAGYEVNCCQEFFDRYQYRHAVCIETPTYN